jgi:hypothetical protein
MEHGSAEITCLQVLLEDASVCSTQRVTLPSGTDVTPAYLLDLYLGYITRFTVRGTGIHLISFHGPLYHEDNNVRIVEMRITGGILVQPENCHRGELQISVERAETGMVVSLHLADYCPLILGSCTPARWRKWLYRLTQAYIHRVITIRFLKLVVRTISAGQLCARVVTVKPTQGEKI